MKTHFNFDAIVIGSGPGGEGAAMGLAKKGKSVAVVECYKNVGGGCTHWGTIPSKALRHVISRIIEFNKNPLYSGHLQRIYPSFYQILQHANQVIHKQVSMRCDFYHRNHCQLFSGHARFIDAHRIEVVRPDGTVDILSADHIVIATGSRPYHPKNVDFTHPRIYDSDRILQLKEKQQPKHIIIYGAGVIGCEYASIFRGLGIKVDLINTRNCLLAFLDQEISDALSYHFWDNGVVIRHNEAFDVVEGLEQSVVVHLKSGKKVKADGLLYANGRTGNTDKLRLENIGLIPDGRGFLQVSNMYRTALPHIYAVGDVIGYPSLASAAYDQGRIAAQAITQRVDNVHLIENIPTGIYTIPEISFVGKTEQELTDLKVPYEVGRAQFKHLARAQIAGMDVGSLKILFHRETKAILGIHCFGERAAEILHIGQAIMEQKNGGNTIDYFINTTFNYPTMAEAYRVAALNGLNRLF